MNQNQSEHLNFLGRFFKTCQKSLKLNNIGRSYYEPTQAKHFPEYNLEIWPGFSTQVRLINNQVLLSVESTSKLLRKDSALNYLHELRNANHNNQTINDLLSGQTVITYYNKRNYQIFQVDFSLNPTSTFSLKDGTSVTYVEYYYKRYRIKINDINQPLFIYKNKKDLTNLTYLVPELCYMTGLTEKQRGDFRLMKAVANITKLNAQEKAKEINSLIERLNSNPECSRIMEDYKVSIDPTPLTLTSYKLEPG